VAGEALGGGLAKVPEVAALFHALQHGEALKGMARAGRGRPAAGGPALPAPPAASGSAVGSVLEQLTERSVYYRQVAEDAAAHGDALRGLAAEVRGASFLDDPEGLALSAFVADRLDGESGPLARLVDESAVLRALGPGAWPEAKADALRESEARLRALRGDLAAIAAACRDEGAPEERRRRSAALLAALARREDKLAVAPGRDNADKRLRALHCPSDVEMLRRVRAAASRLAESYTRAALAEADDVLTRTTGPHLLDARLDAARAVLSDAVRHTFRVHQFAGGLDEQARHAFATLQERPELAIDHSLSN